MDLSGKRILIAEDEPDLREIIAEELEACGCTVLQASNGRAAFAIADAERVDLVITDVRMPGGDGVELITSLRGRDSANPPIIVASGFCDLTEEEAVRIGARRMLMKPFDLKVLLQEVADALGTGS